MPVLSPACGTGSHQCRAKGRGQALPMQPRRTQFQCSCRKAEAFVDLTRPLAEQIPVLDVRMYEFFDSIDRFLMQHFGHRYESSHYDLRPALTDNERVQPAWVNVEITWDNVGAVLKRLNNLKTPISKFSDLGNYPIKNLEDLIADLQSVLRVYEENTVCEWPCSKPIPIPFTGCGARSAQGALAQQRALARRQPHRASHFPQKDTVCSHLPHCEPPTVSITCATVWARRSRRTGTGESI